MQQKHSFLFIVLLAAGFTLLAGSCADTSGKDKHGEGPAEVKAIPFVGAFDPEGGRAAEGITLTEKAAERLGIELVKMKEIQDGQGQSRKVVPYDSILYDPDGQTWVYTMREPLTYIREPVTIESVEDGKAILTNGPEDQTTIVTIGIAMLYGIEYGIGQ